MLSIIYRFSLYDFLMLLRYKRILSSESKHKLNNTIYNNQKNGRTNESFEALLRRFS